MGQGTPWGEHPLFQEKDTVSYAGAAWRGERVKSGAGTNKHDHERCCHKVRQETSSQTGLQLSHSTNVFVPQPFPMSMWEFCLSRAGGSLKSHLWLSWGYSIPAVTRAATKQGGASNSKAIQVNTSQNTVRYHGLLGRSDIWLWKDNQQ